MSGKVLSSPRGGKHGKWATVGQVLLHATPKGEAELAVNHLPAARAVFSFGRALSTYPFLSYCTTFIMADSDLAPKFAPFFSFVSGPMESSR